MASFFYSIIDDVINDDIAENKAEVFAVKLIDMRKWCEEQIELCGYDTTCLFIRAVISDLFADDSEFPYKLWRHIQDTCWPDDEEEVKPTLNRFKPVTAEVP